MTIQLDINFDEFEKWLTPEVMENALYNGGFDVELKDEYRYCKVELKNNPKEFQVKGDSQNKHTDFIILPHIKSQFQPMITIENFPKINGAA